MKYKHVLAASKSTEILAVIENLPISASGFFLNDSQMEAINSALTQAEASATAVTDLAAVNEKLQAATLKITELTTALDESKKAADDSAASVTQLTEEVKSWKAKADELGAVTEEPEATGKKIAADPGTGKKRVRDSFDMYADEMGV